MPIIDHRTEPPAQESEGRKSRQFVTKETGAQSLKISELVMSPGSSLRLHTHPHDEAIVLLEGSIEMTAGEDIRIVVAGHTLLAPPGIPHRLANKSGADARLYAITPVAESQTTYVD